MDEYWNSCDWILLIFLIRLCFPILNLWNGWVLKQLWLNLAYFFDSIVFSYSQSLYSFKKVEIQISVVASLYQKIPNRQWSDILYWHGWVWNNFDCDWILLFLIRLCFPILNLLNLGIVSKSRVSNLSGCFTASKKSKMSLKWSYDFSLDEYWNSCDWILRIFLIRLCFPILNLGTVSKSRNTNFSGC